MSTITTINSADILEPTSREKINTNEANLNTDKIEIDGAQGTPARGDILVAKTATPVWKKLLVGLANTVLATNGTDPSWRKVVNADCDDDMALAISKTALGTYTPWTDFILNTAAVNGTFTNSSSLRQYKQVEKTCSIDVCITGTGGGGCGSFNFSAPIAPVNTVNFLVSAPIITIDNVGTPYSNALVTYLATSGKFTVFMSGAGSLPTVSTEYHIQLSYKVA